MKFELDRLTDYSEAALILELRRVAELTDREKLTVGGFSKRSKVGVTTLRRRFGSWRGALEAAGLSHLFNPAPPATKSRVLARSLSTEQVLAEIRRVAQLLGRTELTSQDLREHALIGVDAIRRRFGSLKGAIRNAGLQESAHGRRYTDEECFENLLRVWTHYGRPPRHREMKLQPSIVGPKAYMVRWGTWSRALQAFIVSVDGDFEKPPQLASTIAALQPLTNGSRSQGDEQRIPLSLRYKVLVRDEFKCRLCGDSPAVNPGCRLHVDHLYPWSKGGKTVAENLRSLCQQCNLGKGSSLIENQCIRS